MFFDSPQQSQQAVENRQRMGRTAGDVKIDRDDRLGPVSNFRMTDERPP
jgi:hypothetical protein